MKQLSVLIESNKKIAEDYYILSLKSGYLARKAKPGQFINVKCADNTVPLLRKPFGVNKIHKKGIDILYKIVGNGTRLLSLKSKGDKLDIIGPLGEGVFTYNKSTGKEKAILVGGGHGVAPLYALTEQLLSSKKGMRVSVFIGAKDKSHLVCAGTLRKLGAKVYEATENGSKGYKGLVTDLVKREIEKTQKKIQQTIYACGPKAMLKAVAKLAQGARIECQVSMEEYLGCGIGICKGCTIGTCSGKQLICKDGPVFDAKEIIWD